MLKIETKAPDFTLNSTPDLQLSLNELKGKKVMLAFYPADRSPVCSNEMSLRLMTIPDTLEKITKNKK